jgi:hypothetical protein
MSAVALSRLSCDQMLRGPRGVKRWRKKISSYACRRASIQPKQIAASSTSG